MWYSCTTLAVELKIEVLYKRDDGVWNTFGSDTLCTGGWIISK